MKRNELSPLAYLLGVLLLVYITPASTYTCPAGSDCISDQICSPDPIKCEPGLYCPGDFNSAVLCEKGQYCPTPDTTLDCPSGKFCRTSSTHPTDCEALGLCPTKTFKQRRFISVLIDFLVLFLVLTFTFGYKRILSLFSTSPQLPSSFELTTKSSSNVKEDDELSMFKVTPQIDLAFENVGYHLKTKKGPVKHLMEGVSGEFRSGHVNAILGPSGAGKTTLMNVLCGKIKKTSGKIYVNGHEDQISNYKKLVGFVPQDDIMLRTLTVRQNIEHSARLRLPSSWSRSERKKMVDQVIQLLKLEHVQHSVIGDAEKRGISGGERKRVNIGIELVACPHLLFLDEPTTGLDSTTSKEIMSFLQKIAHNGTNVIAVVHQPRYEIVEMCDSVLLLGKGGRTVFLGKTEDALDYFKEIGFECPEFFNPADFMLDVLSGKVPRNQSAQENSKTLTQEAPDTTVNVQPIVSPQFDTNDLFTLWEQHAATQKLFVTSTQADAGKAINPDSVKRETAGFFRQIGIYLYRSALQQIQDLKGLALEISYQIIPGVAMGISSLGDEMYQPPIPIGLASLCPSIISHRCQHQAIQEDGLSISSFFITMVFGVAAVVAANRTFGEEKTVYYREASSGINRLSYFIARNIFDLWNIARNTFIILTFFLLMADPPGSWGKWFGSVYFLMFCGYGIGYFVSNLVSLDKSLVISLVAAVALSVTSGLSPTLTQLKDYKPLNLFWYISYNRWAAESMILNELDSFKHMRYEESIANYGYTKGNYGLDLGVMVIIGIAWRVFAYLALILVNRRKQK